MIQYWTLWNLSWISLVQLNYILPDYALITSSIITSIVGGFITHVYPKKLKLRINNKIISISYLNATIIDLLTHQIPLFILYKKRNSMILNRCGSRLLIPVTFYTGLNYLRNTPLSITYGIKTSYIYTSGLSILSFFGLYYHVIFNKKN